jgi:hypothetical protein
MREVQLAAQKVANDNSRLRALLRFKGVEEKVIESWLRGDETLARMLPISDVLSPRSPISRATALGNVSARLWFRRHPQLSWTAGVQYIHPNMF